MGISGFLHLYHKRSIFLLFRFSLFTSFEKSAENENRNRKAAFFAVFA